MKRALFSFILIFILQGLGHSQDLACNTGVPVGTIEKPSNQTPFLFEENLGQVRDTDGNQRADVLFTAQSKGMNVYLRTNRLSFVFSKSCQGDPIVTFENTPLIECQFLLS